MHYVIPWLMAIARIFSLPDYRPKIWHALAPQRSGAKMAHRYYKAEGFRRIPAGGRAGQHLLMSTLHRRFSYSRVSVGALAARGLLVRWSSCWPSIFRFRLSERDVYIANDPDLSAWFPSSLATRERMAKSVASDCGQKPLVISGTAYITCRTTITTGFRQGPDRAVP